MKLALIGDIHGNAPALQAALAAASSVGVEKLLVTGDLVGYYYEPLKVLELLQPWNKHMVRGNHEDMLSVARSNPAFLAEMDKRYGGGLRSALEQLEGRQIDELCNLPHPLELSVDGCRILLCHGAPWDINQYVYPNAAPEMLERCAMQDFDLVVMGHTHYPAQHRIGRTLVVNPGSVGQPRNRQPGAHWAFFDTNVRSVLFHREDYEISTVAMECTRRNPEQPYLADVLMRSN